MNYYLMNRHVFFRIIFRIILDIFLILYLLIDLTNHQINQIEMVSIFSILQNYLKTF